MAHSPINAKLIFTPPLLDEAERQLLVIDKMDNDKPSSPMMIGRDEDANVVMQNMSISHKHATLAMDDNGTLIITDIGSKVGTFIKTDEGELKLTPNIKHRLLPGDVVRLGEMQLITFEFIDHVGGNVDAIKAARVKEVRHQKYASSVQALTDQTEGLEKLLKDENDPNVASKMSATIAVYAAEIALLDAERKKAPQADIDAAKKLIETRKQEIDTLVEKQQAATEKEAFEKQQAALLRSLKTTSKELADTKTKLTPQSPEVARKDLKNLEIALADIERRAAAATKSEELETCNRELVNVNERLEKTRKNLGPHWFKQHLRKLAIGGGAVAFFVFLFAMTGVINKRRENQATAKKMATKTEKVIAKNTESRTPFPGPDTTPAAQTPVIATAPNPKPISPAVTPAIEVAVSTATTSPVVQPPPSTTSKLVAVDYKEFKIIGLDDGRHTWKRWDGTEKYTCPADFVPPVDKEGRRQMDLTVCEHAS